MNKIIKGLLNSFKKEQSLGDNLPEHELFEHFANYCIVSKEYNDSFNLDKVYVGGSGDNGIDGIAIIVNGNLVSSKDEIEDLAKFNKYLDVSFVLVQSKTSTNFDSGDIAKFLTGSKDFFKNYLKSSCNDQIKEKVEIVEEIYNKSNLFKNRNPVCKLYYVTTGKWLDDQKLNNTINSLKENIEGLQQFSDVNFTAVDADLLQKLYRFANNKISKEIKIEKRIALPEIQNIREAYIGILPAKEYLKLILDDSKNLIRGLFYDNVRDYQGENDVNNEIRDTIRSGKPEHEAFILYNNGITIVAESLNVVGDKVTISDYQIVNGCQTSHVLYNNQDKISDSLYISVKIIVLDRSNTIKNNIIKCNNRQTPVKLEELEALTDFQKKLEEYYNSFDEENKRLYYERRSKQYCGEEIEKIRIIDLSSQIRCFASMFLDQAHHAGRYYGRLMEESKDKFFLDSHNPIGYYVSAYANFRLDALFRKGQIENKYRPFRYHMLNILRMQVSEYEMPEMETNKFIRYCQKIEKVLFDDNTCKNAFKKTTSIIDQAVKEINDGKYDRAVAKKIKFSNKIKSLLSN